MNQKEFGKKIAEQRKKLGISQEELAKKCNMDIRSIQRIEAGEVNARSYTKKILAEALCIEDDIFTENENNPGFISAKSFFQYLFAFNKDSTNQLKIAWIAGLIYFAIGIPEFVLEIMIQDSYRISSTFNFVNIVVSLIAVISAVLFYNGFAVIGRLKDNIVICISAYIIIIATILSYNVDIFALESTLEFRKAIQGAESVTFGFLCIFFGIGLLRLETHYGDLAKFAGLLEIFAGITFVIIILFFIGLIILIPATIIEILLLYRAYTKSYQVAYA